MLFELNIKSSKKQEIIDITKKVEEVVKSSEIEKGICIVYVPHATAGIIINENFDKYLCEDILNSLDKIAPQEKKYEHNRIDDNAHSHIKASIIGPSKTIILKKRELLLGRWQGIALAEFDGPKDRKIFVKIIQD